MNPVKAAAVYWKVTVVAVLFVVVAGVHSLFVMPRREDPKITIRKAVVVTVLPGASSDRVEQLVSRRIEDKLATVEELKEISSASRPSLSVVQLELYGDVQEPHEVWQKIRNKMKELQPELPATVIGPRVNDEYGDTVAQLIAISGGGYPLSRLEDYARLLETEVRHISAVGKTELLGAAEERIEVAPRIEQITGHRIGPERLVQALRARNILLPGGQYQTDHSDLPVEPSGDIRSLAELENLVVDLSPSGLPLRLADIANIERTAKDQRFLARFNGRQAVYLSVTMRAGGNVVEMGEEIAITVARARQLLPPDVEIHLLADQPQVVRERIDHFLLEFLLAVICVIAVTMLLLPFRTSLVAATAIPVTVLGTFALMRAAGIELHQVSISTLILVVGMVVDDAIVITDNYHEHLETGKVPFDAAIDGTRELAVPVLAATLTIVASFLPLRMISGAVGEFISAIPSVVAIALLASYFVAMLVTPLLCIWLIPRHAGTQGGGLLSWIGPVRRRWPTVAQNPLEALRNSYGRLLSVALAHRKMTLAATALALLLGALVLPTLGRQFFPKAERNQFIIDVWAPEGTRVAATDRMVRKIEERLRRQPEIIGFGSFIGKSAPRFYYNVNPEQDAANYAQLIVNTASDQDVPGLVAMLRGELGVLAPGARVLVKELQQGTPLEAPIMVRVVGPNVAELKRIGSEVQRILSRTDGVWETNLNTGEDLFQLSVQVDPEKASRSGVTNYATAMMLAGAFSGVPVSYLREGKRQVPIALRVDEGQRASLERMADLPIPSLSGNKIPLRQIARITPGWQTARIQRHQRERAVTVRAFTAGRLADAALAEARPAIEALPLPAHYRIEYGGEVEELHRSFGELRLALVVGTMLIFFVLVLEFKSFAQPWIVMAAIPLSVPGAAVGLLLSRSPFGFMAFLGIVSLAGIVVRNAIVLIDYANHALRSGVEVTTAVRQAGERRLRPILLTTLAAVVGMTPMLLSGSSLWVPMASAIAAGLLGSTFLTLVVIPVLVVMLEAPRHKRVAP